MITRSVHTNIIFARIIIIYLENVDVSFVRANIEIAQCNLILKQLNFYLTLHI